jgi:hypothetical protein
MQKKLMISRCHSLRRFHGLIKPLHLIFILILIIPNLILCKSVKSVANNLCQSLTSNIQNIKLENPSLFLPEFAWPEYSSQEDFVFTLI